MQADTLELLESGQQLRVLLMQFFDFPLKADHVLPVQTKIVVMVYLLSIPCHSGYLYRKYLLLLILK